MVPPITLEDTNDLLLKVFLVGYPEMGESIVVILVNKRNKAILHTTVIDCYSTGGVNKTVDILNACNVQRLDVLCWTHTDEDHSIGIDTLVNDFCDNKTVFILPGGVHGETDDFVTYNPQIEATFKLINQFNKGREYNVCTASANTFSHHPIRTWRLLDLFNREVKLTILALAPNSAIIRRKESGTGKTVNKNEISVALVYKIGELSFFFSGDIENQALRLVDQEELIELDFIKTPHHTSLTTDQLLPILIDINDPDYKTPICCSTSYKANKLPHPALVDEYKQVTDSFYCTNSNPETANYGVIQVDYDILSKKSYIYTHGNATKLFQL